MKRFCLKLLQTFNRSVSTFERIDHLVEFRPDKFVSAPALFGGLVTAPL